MISRCLCQPPQLRVILWAGPSHPLGIARLAPKASLAATAAAAQETSGHSHDLFPLWYLTWNLLIDNACSLRKAHTVEEDYTESSTRIASGYRPQLWDFMLLSFYKAGGKLWVATSTLQHQRQLRDAFLWTACSLATLLSVKGQCSKGMGFCQPYQFLHRASARASIFQPDIARRYVLWHSLANQNHSRQFKLQSIVFNIMFVFLICSSHKERLRIKKTFFFS